MSLMNADFGFVHQVLSYERVHEQTVSFKARSLNSYDPSLLNDLVIYGPSCLTPEELKNRVEEVLDRYYRFLSVSVFHFRDKEFWTYHKRRMLDCGHSLSYFKLASALFGKCLDLILNPKASIEKLARRFAAQRD